MSDQHECKYCDGMYPCAADDTIADYPTRGYTGIPIEVHKRESVEFGRREEREAIVAWLWARADQEGIVYIDGFDLARIENGEHVKNSDNSLHVSETSKEGLHDE